MSQTWFLYYNHLQHGPFSYDEVQSQIQKGLLHEDVFVWREGLSDWITLSDCDEFEVKSQSKPPELVSDQRHAPRKPLIAKVVSTDQKEVIFGICRDVSIGGMQVLSERVPGQVGSKISLNISPSSEDHLIKPFVAKGTIVRLLENQKGFSFRFDDLSDDVKEIINEYVKSAD